MPFGLETFAVARPFLYHLTSAENLVRICELGRLESAAALLSQAQRDELLRARRAKHVPIRVEGREVWLRDQAPLHAVNVDFLEGWQLGDLVANGGRQPIFCRYNSGSPRYSGGRASPRGPQTFVTQDNFLGGPARVVEVAFEQGPRLPLSTEYGFTPAGPWKILL